MKKLVHFVLFVLSVLSVLIIAVICYAADPVTAPAVGAGLPAVVVPTPSIIDWFTAYKAYIFGAALAISEVLGVTPWFKGNGILDTIVKGLKLLAGKDQPT